MTQVSEQILTIAVRYLGPEAKRFLERQMSHMEGAPSFSDLQEKDVDKFAWWVNVSAKLIMDKEKAKELSNKIAALGYAGRAQ